MEPLDPALRSLVDDGLREAWPPPAVEERVLRRILDQLPGGDGPPDDGSDGPPIDGDAAVDPTAIAGAARVSALSSTLKAILIVGLITGGAAALSSAVGELGRPRRPAATGATSAPATAADERGAGDIPVPEDSYDEAALPADEANVEATDARAAAASGARARPPARPRAPNLDPQAPRRAPDDPPAPAVDPLLAETRAVAEAEAALARGDHGRARALVRALARDLPGGQLALERAAIDLSAGCGLAEPGAGAAARAFLRAHPRAPVAAKIEARCADALRSTGE